MKRPERAQASLTRRLLLGVLAALLLVWAGFALLALRTGVHEADELTDGHLAGTAALLLALELPPSAQASLEPGRAANLHVARPSLATLKKHDYQFSLSVLVRNSAGQVLLRSGEAPLPPFALQDGFADLRLGAPATAWRSFSQWDAAKSRQVMVLVKAGERDELAMDVAEQLAEPGLWLLPVVALALGLSLWRGLRPLQALSRDVEALEGEVEVDSAARLPARHRYREFNAVVRAINQLLGQQQAALERERQLADDIAHELRTPLASIALQAAALKGSLPAAQQAAALSQLSADALRAGHVIGQLLALARAGQASLQPQLEALDVAALARQVVAEHAQAAWQSGHQLSVQGTHSLQVRAHPLLLALALRNLIDNALQHTSAGTAVCVEWGSGAGGDEGAWLQVCDDGARHSAGALAPAQPPTGERLGLGHKIVQRVMMSHGGSFSQIAALPPFTRCYRLTFAAPAAPA
ncbi:MAG: histidine kinase dimerization/phospho-acceptor domain-containing protein [Polaromonas sp.]